MNDTPFDNVLNRLHLASHTQAFCIHCIGALHRLRMAMFIYYI
jgi:hypothetical protein